MRLRSDRLLLSPSDLNNFLACRRRTALDLRLAHGEIELERIPRPAARRRARSRARARAGVVGQLDLKGPPKVKQ